MRKSLKIYLIIIAVIVLAALLTTAVFACISRIKNLERNEKTEIFNSYYIPVFYTESVWMSSDSTFCIVTKTDSSGFGKSTLAYVKGDSGAWEECSIYESGGSFVIFKKDSDGHTWRVAFCEVSDASEKEITLSPSAAYPAKEKFGLSLENELRLKRYDMGAITLPFETEEVAS